MLVVTEDLVSRPRIEIRQGGAAPAYFEELGGEAAPASVAANALQSLFGGSAHGGRDRFSGYRRKFSHEFFCNRILDVERHAASLCRIVLPIKIDYISP
jgi:hypothetical protein